MFNVKENVVQGNPFLVEEGASGPWRLSRRAEIVLLGLVVAGQVAILVFMIVIDGLPLVLGERVKLQVQPVDPRDMFRGDYVVLAYDYSRMQPQGLPSYASGRYDWRAAEQDVYVKLKRQGDCYVTESVTTTRPTDGKYLQGKMNWSHRVECGIEACYVQEGEGLRLEGAIRQRQLVAEVAILNGKGKLVRLIE